MSKLVLKGIGKNFGSFRAVDDESDLFAIPRVHVAGNASVARLAGEASGLIEFLRRVNELKLQHGTTDVDQMDNPSGFRDRRRFAFRHGCRRRRAGRMGLAPAADGTPLSPRVHDQRISHASPSAKHCRWCGSRAGSSAQNPSASFRFSPAGTFTDNSLPR